MLHLQWGPCKIYLCALVFFSYSISSGESLIGKRVGLKIKTRSPVQVASWAKAEILFVQRLTSGKLKLRSLNGEEINGTLNSYVTDFENSHHNLRGYQNGTIDEKVKAIASNPITIFQMAVRIVRILGKLENNCSPDLKLLFPRPWLLEADIEDCISNMGRILYYYDIPIKSFSNGNILGIETGASLTSKQCYDIAFVLKNQTFHHYYVEFLEVALEKHGDDGLIPTDKARRALHNALVWHDYRYRGYIKHEFLDAGFKYTFNMELLPAKAKYGPFEYFIRRPVKSEFIETHLGSVVSFNYTTVNCWELCKRGNIDIHKAPKLLFCWLETQRHPYWYINPLKMEFLARSPDITIFHDLIRERKIQDLINSAAKEQLIDSTTQFGSGGPKDIRVSVQRFMSRKEHPAYESVDSIVEKITGFEHTLHPSAQPLQIAAYSYGGYYVSHPDAPGVDVKHDPLGPRIATFMIYLEEPERGGRTAFPMEMLVAEPRKGSAVLWYNNYRDGEADEQLEHCACPVVYGTKWIATKWIHLFDQFLTHKCSLEQKERFHFIPNAKQNTANGHKR